MPDYFMCLKKQKNDSQYTIALILLLMTVLSISSMISKFSLLILKNTFFKNFLLGLHTTHEQLL